MSIFDKVLKEGETLFLNDIALSYEYVPKLIPYRESQQKRVAACIAPLFQDRSGRNIVVHGLPGVGKTVAVRNILNELEERTDQIIPIYINCWLKNTSYKIILEMCEIIDYKFTHNKKTDELFDIVATRLNKLSTVFVFDEIDKADDLDFLYLILQKIHKKAVVLLSNYKEVVTDMDMRIRSRLTPEMLEFAPYTQDETKGILQQRVELAFYPNVWKKTAFEKVVTQTHTLQDIRIGLYLLKESAIQAEERSLKFVDEQSVEPALEKLKEYTIKNKDDLEDTTKVILDLIKQNPQTKIGELYKMYSDKHRGTMSYKTFSRKIAKLEEGKFITIEKTEGGAQGNTSIISYNEQTKTLDDF